MPAFRRKRIRLETVRYQGRQIYFVTICSNGRRRILTDSAVAERLIHVLREQSTAHLFDVYAYCVMPDHLHLLVMGLSETSDLFRFIRVFKGNTAADLRKQGIRNLWQNRFFDHILRPGESPEAVAWYIFQNPVRAGLVGSAADWPHSGSRAFDLRNFTAPMQSFIPPWKNAQGS